MKEFFDRLNRLSETPRNVANFPGSSEQVQISRKKFFKTLLALSIGGAIYATGVGKLFSSQESRESIENREEISSKNRGILTQKPPIGFHKDVVFPKMSQVHLVGEVSKYGVVGEKASEESRLQGSILRGMRYKNITDAVEDRYHLPRHLLFALMVEESTGGSTLLNGQNDGGAGWCHMQPDLSKQFGLTTFENNNEGKPGKAYGKRMREAFSKHGYENMPDKDERFHPLKNIDAAGRMLAYHFCGPHIEREKFKKLAPIQTAVARYSGAYNYGPRYWPDVIEVMQRMNDEKFLDAMEKEFNTRNPNFSFEGEKIEEGKQSDSYFQNFWDYNNKKYGLEEYKKLPQYFLRARSGETSKECIEYFQDHVMEDSSREPFIVMQ